MPDVSIWLKTQLNRSEESWSDTPIGHADAQTRNQATGKVGIPEP